MHSYECYNTSIRIHLNAFMTKEELFVEAILIPGNGGQHCPSNGECCDECDYLICRTNYNGLCDKCFEENGACEGALF